MMSSSQRNSPRSIPTAPALIAAADASLKRLNTDHIDLYQSHWPNADVPEAETLEALGRLVRDGKVRHVGFSNVTPGELERLLALGSDLPIRSVQMEYSLAARWAEHAMLPVCRRHGLALIAYTPMGVGKITDPRRSEALAAVAARHGATPSQVMLAWLVADPAVIPIPMTLNPEHLRQNAAAAALTLTDRDRADLDAAFALDIREVPVAEIKVAGSVTGKAYANLNDARANTLGLSPSPTALAAELAQAGELLKPVKARPTADGFELFEGQLRYWAWVIAFDGARPIPVQVEQS